MTDPSNEHLIDELEKACDALHYMPSAQADARHTAIERALSARAAVLARMSSPFHDRAMAEGGWRDIASAPKDGTCVLCVEFDEPQKVVDMHWFSDGVHGSWRGAVGQYRRPLKWCELPAPPTPTTKEETA
jgi:hypothetical protein